VRIAKVNIGDLTMVLKRAAMLVSPDTGLGHIASSVGTPNVVLHVNNPVLWSSMKSIRVMDKSAIRAYKSGERDYGEAWGAPDRFTSYYVNDRSGNRGGASNIDPGRVSNAMQRVSLRVR